MFCFKQKKKTFLVSLFTIFVTMTLHQSFVIKTLHQNCYHQIIFAKVNIKIFYPPPYKLLVSNYSNENVQAINSAIESFNWENTFDGKGIHAQVALFSETILNIFSNFISNRTKPFIGSDPPWMTDDIKNKIKLKKCFFYRQYMRHQISGLLKIEDFPNEIKILITKSKEKNYQLILTHN